MMDRAFYTFRARYDTDRCADWWRYSGLMAAISSAAIFRCVNFFSRLNFHSNAQQQLHEVRIISSCRVSTNFLCHITVSWTPVSARILALQWCSSSTSEINWNWNWIISVSRFSCPCSSGFDFQQVFLPRDAMPARYMLSSCLSVRLSHAGIVSKRIDGLNWFWVRELSLTYHKLCYKKIQVPKGISLWNLAQNSGRRKFRHRKSTVWSTKLVDGRACGSHLRRSSTSWLNALSLLHVSRM